MVSFSVELYWKKSLKKREDFDRTIAGRAGQQRAVLRKPHCPDVVQMSGFHGNVQLFGHEVPDFYGRVHFRATADQMTVRKLKQIDDSGKMALCQGVQLGPLDKVEHFDRAAGEADGQVTAGEHKKRGGTYGSG